MIPSTLLALLAGSSTAAARSVFAHYMVGGVEADHAETDVQDAIAVGLDAFAMNLGSPGETWAQNCIEYLFNAAEGTNFGLFFSFDLLQDSNFDDFLSIFEQYKDHPNYYKTGPNNWPLVSSYGGYNQQSNWASLKADYDIFLMPNLDDPWAGQGETSPYYTNPSGELSGFNSIVDGYFSWEAAWPESTSGPVTADSGGDVTLITYAHDNGKDYMMALSTFQYKNMESNHWYRIGEVNLAQRMHDILAIIPEYTEIITWNDGGESHYFGNVWNETQGSDSLVYANDYSWPHTAWQPLITSFITAFKNGQSSSQMAPPTSSAPIGSMWYRAVLINQCSNPPSNYQSALDAVNYAIVIPASSSGLTIRVSINGNTLSSTAASAGLNFASVTGLTSGTPRVDVVDSSGSVKWSAVGTATVQSGSVNCNFNYNVYGLN